MKTTEGTITVCAWCHPKDSIFQVHPEWQGLGLKITHGICFEHRKKLEQELEACSSGVVRSGKSTHLFGDGLNG